MKEILFLGLISVFFLNGYSKNDPHKEKKPFDPSKFAVEHVLDSHEWHIGDVNGYAISIPLPIILIDNGKINCFMSSAFEHGAKVVERNGVFYKLYHQKIYHTDADGTITLNEEEQPINTKPLDLSITKNTTSMLIAMIVLFIILYKTANSYKKSIIPKGIAGFIEPIVIFIRDEIAIPNIGERKYNFFLPYLLTIFFFIWINNLFGLLPIPPGGGANVTGNIAITMLLSLGTLLLTNIYANKNYWKHIFNPLGNSFPTTGKVFLYLILVPVEIIGIFTKPFALMIRLFANITAGHIIIICLTSLIFIFKTSLIALASVPFVLFINCIELLVALLQAYIFTLLSALFIGLAVKEHEAESTH